MFEYIRSASRRMGAGGRSREGTLTEAFFVVEGRGRLAAAVVGIDDAAAASAAEDEEANAASFEPPPFIPFASVATRRSGRGACDWRVGIRGTSRRVISAKLFFPLALSWPAICFVACSSRPCRPLES